MRYLGPTRPLGKDTYEQYDTSPYRQICQSLAQTAAAELDAYVKAGYCALCILGVDGSPSCAVSRVPHATPDGRSQLEPGSGLFMEFLSDRLLQAGLDIPLFGLPENPQVGDITATLRILQETILPPRKAGGEREQSARN